MAYELDDFCEDCKDLIDPATGKKDLEAVRKILEKLCHNQEFLDANCGPGAVHGVHTLYRDPDKDFMVLAHINDQGRTSPPHDHGASWAIYCQAVEYTEMTLYDRTDDGATEGHAELEESEKFRLDPGNAGYFDSHKIHSIHFPDGARFIRVTGTDLPHLTTKRFSLKDKTVTVVTPNDKSGAAGSTAA